MYCDTPQVNQLTALIIAAGIRHIVCCPGSRNATIVHNLHEAAEQVVVHPITDERSATFVALGMALATGEGVAVCVTSGSALLACLPGVAEAYYRHLPLLVISADRPPCWIGQLDGQTLPQQGALEPYCHTQQLVIAQSEADHWTNNLRINRSLAALTERGGGPAHVNVPIAEPMFHFTTPALPAERYIRTCRATTDKPLPPDVVDRLAKAKCPALIIGQWDGFALQAAVAQIDAACQLLVLPELIANVGGNQRMNVLDELTEAKRATLLPDVIVQVGGNFIHKRFKQWLRAANCSVIRISEDCDYADTFCHLDTAIAASPRTALEQLAAELPHAHAGVVQARSTYDQLAAEQLTAREAGLTTSTAALSIDQSFGHLQRTLRHASASTTLHIGNSTSIRAAQRWLTAGLYPIYCNRGTNGIEGSLSAAVGYAMCHDGLTIAAVGDLSFFYDANALWNVHLPANLRILLFNNGHGAIFDHLPGLEQSAARDALIAAGQPSYRAAGIAEAFHLDYQLVTEAKELTTALDHLLDERERPLLLEIITHDS